MTINNIIKIGLTLALFILVSCQKEDIQKSPATRTIIAYMAANNDFADDASVSLQQMEQGFSEKGVNLIVFIAESGENPQLVEIHPGKEKVVKTYSVINTADPAVLKEVLQDAIDFVSGAGIRIDSPIARLFVDAQWNRASIVCQ